MLVCKGICNQHRSKTPASKGIYSNGFRRCKVCDCYYKTESNRCICCGGKLAMFARNYRHREVVMIA